MENNGRMVLNMPLGTFIAILALTGGIVATHFQGISDANTYTDKKVERIQNDINEIRKEQKEMAVKMENVDSNTKLIKEIMVKRFGQPTHTEE